MKTVFVRDLLSCVNQEVTTFFLVLSKETRFKKTGEPYLSLLLGDCTGEVEARQWDNVETVPEFERDDVIKVKGLLQVFRNKPQLAIHKLRRARDTEVELRDYFRTAARDAGEMFEELLAVVAGIANPHIRALLEQVLADEEIASRFRRAPAAKSLHHAYLGGLLEHVLSLCGLARLVAGHYPALDLDLLLAGCVLHDIGKIYELDYNRGISYTTPGHLLGHIVIGVEMVERKIREIADFPEPLRVLIEHFIVSHHGEYEYGSPKLPAFSEALVFHYLDDLDAKVNHMAWHLEADGSVEGEWTSRSASLGRSLLKVQKYMPAGEGEDSAAAAAAAATAEGPVAPVVEPSLAAAAEPASAEAAEPAEAGSETAAEAAVTPLLDFGGDGHDS